MSWINKDTEIYCSFAKQAGNTGCQMMNSAFYYYGLNKIYKSFSVDNIEEAVKSVRTLGIKGFAITMPYKIEVLDYVDELDDSVKEIQSANTVINDNGKLTAYNTDYYAAKQMLSRVGGKRLYILGNGGYSKAVQQAAKHLNFNYSIITRDNWEIINSITNSVVYNCTPIDVDIDNTNTYINSNVKSKTGMELATLQAEKQFKLYTGLDFPIRG